MPCLADRVHPRAHATVSRSGRAPRIGRPGSCGDRLGLAQCRVIQRSVSGRIRRLYDFELEPEVRDWLDSLSDSDFKRVDEVCGLLAEKGTELGGPWSRRRLGRRCAPDCRTRPRIGAVRTPRSLTVKHCYWPPAAALTDCDARCGHGGNISDMSDTCLLRWLYDATPNRATCIPVCHNATTGQRPDLPNRARALDAQL